MVCNTYYILHLISLQLYHTQVGMAKNDIQMCTFIVKKSTFLRRSRLVSCVRKQVHMNTQSCVCVCVCVNLRAFLCVRTQIHMTACLFVRILIGKVQL
jgi:hypothetical protein